MDKKALRESVLQKRRGLSRELVIEHSRAIQRHIMESAAWKKARVIALYAAFDNEVQTDLLFQEILKTGRTAAYPRLRGRGPEMDFCEVHNLKRMVRHPFGIPEPEPNARVIDLPEIDLLLVPGVAFDRTGARLGLGGGCYDRILNRLKPGAFRLGVGYEVQVVSGVPREEHDVLMDGIVTEKGFIPLRHKPQG